MAALFASSEFWSAIVGALVGGAFSIIGQVFASNAQRAERLADHKEERRVSNEGERKQELVLALSIMLKVNRALSTITQFHDHLHSGRIAAWRARMPFSGGVLAISTNPERIQFDLNEIVLVRSLKNNEWTNRVIDLPAVHNMYIDSMILYMSKREQLSGLLSSATLRKDGPTTTAYEGVNAYKAQIVTIELDSTLEVLWSRSMVDLPRTQNLMRGLQKSLIDRYGKADLGFFYDVPERIEPPDNPSSFSPLRARIQPSKSVARRAK